MTELDRDLQNYGIACTKISEYTILASTSMNKLLPKIETALVVGKKVDQISKDIKKLDDNFAIFQKKLELFDQKYMIRQLNKFCIGSKEENFEWIMNESGQYPPFENSFQALLGLDIQQLRQLADFYKIKYVETESNNLLLRKIQSYLGFF
ncbi:unnamed protein product [Brachionus calyciflorus]|uniref:Uncharacterized protein n=1 Tax=Brachionus calyciflorus TaxID=104777 RepID=A0A814B932_9BILA|nr:unnamed protein product [Brachionus calyciflorus]